MPSKAANFSAPGRPKPLCEILTNLSEPDLSESARSDRAKELFTNQTRITGAPIAMEHGCRTSIFSRSEEHTSELQSRGHLVCRLLLDKKNIQEDTVCM